MSDRNAMFLKEMGLGPRWVLRHAAQQSGASVPTDITPVSQPAIQDATLVPRDLASVAVMDWAALTQSVAACRSCALCEGRSNTVFGAGDPKANWLFIGAAPDAEDEAAGRPLAGRSGSLFNNMLLALGLGPDQNVYLTNLLKCLPAEGAARPAELAACRPYLERQISLLAPTIIVALGAEVAGALLADATASLSGLRGRLHQFAGLPLVVTYAPQDLLRSPAAKAGAWSDLCLAQTCDVSRP